MTVEIYSIIIIMVLLTQIYFNYCRQNINNFTDIWSKVDDNNYHFKLKSFNRNAYKEWKDIVEDFSYDKEEKEIIIKSIDEPRALALLNLYLSHSNGDITMNEMFENNIINRSITKARKNKVVIEKLTNLIKENNVVRKYNKVEDYNNVSREIVSEKQIQQDAEKSIDVHPPLQPIQQEKIENVSSCAIANNHLENFSYDSILGNTVPVDAYGGNEYASPFSSYYN